MNKRMIVVRIPFKPEFFSGLIFATAENSDDHSLIHYSHLLLYAHGMLVFALVKPGLAWTCPAAALAHERCSVRPIELHKTTCYPIAGCSV